MPPGPIEWHPSRDPAMIGARMRESLRTRLMDHQFHYVSARQAERWLALHQRYSPSRHDPGCERIYGLAFNRCAEECSGLAAVQLIGLGCGGGRKDARLLGSLWKAGRPLRYVAADVSQELVEGALRHVEKVLPAELSCRGLVADFMETKDLEAYWRKGAAGERQVFSFLGMIPNFDPEQALGRLTEWLREGDLLVVSANLAPGPDWAEGCRLILPQYDNEETRRWLVAVMEDLGVDVEISDLEFQISDFGKGGTAYKRVECHLVFPRDCRLCWEEDIFFYKKGERFRLFYSNRFQPGMLDSLLEGVGFRVLNRFIIPSEEEGVWVVEKMVH